MKPLTFCSESIADLCQRLLYTSNCSNIAVREVETSLSATLTLATRRNAVALIDEAGVFMAERRLNDLHNDELVSSQSV
jgi:hypothetical protein